MKTKISGLHFTRTPISGKNVEIVGYLKLYDEESNSWLPVEHKKVKLIIDDREVAESITDSFGKFKFNVKLSGEHEIQIVFEGTRKLDGCSLVKYISAVSEEEWIKIRKLAKIMFIIIFLMIAIIVILGVFLR